MTVRAAPSIVKQSYERAMRVPQVGRAAGDPFGVWEDFFEQLHLGLTSLPTYDIINDGKGKEMTEMCNAKLLWGRAGLELWRTDTEYNVPKFHVFNHGREILATFNVSEAIESIRKIRRRESWGE